ncbi:paeninodin family lasso peptide [Paraliobacillus sediminis]|nr:paeninodin family lasso peptide [Paraliobacillus sediminis]
MTKQEWKQPVLEVLDVSLTMAAENPGTRLDAAWSEGTLYEDLTWS